MKKHPVIFGLIVFGVLLAMLIVSKKLGWIGKEFKEKVTVEKVALRSITEIITANGKIKPETEVKISSDVSGEIIELYVAEGDKVKLGEKLARIQPDIYERNLEKTEASVRNTEANLAQMEALFTQARLGYQRSKGLFDQKAIAQQEFEKSEADYQVAKANLSSAKASMRNALASQNEARDNLSKTNIYAPMDGIVSKLNVEKGERVVGTAQFEGTSLMTIANLAIMEVVVDVNENDIIRVKKGDTCVIEVDAYLKNKFKGVVTEIANSANVEGVSADQVINFEVKILVLPESYAKLLNEKGINYPLRPGMSATVEIQTNTVSDCLTVPIQSVTLRNDTLVTDSVKIKQLSASEKHEVVFIVKNGKALQRNVETGIQNTQFIQITEGLNLDEEVASGPYSAISRKLKHNMAVEVSQNLMDEKIKK